MFNVGTFNNTVFNVVPLATQNLGAQDVYVFDGIGLQNSSIVVSQFQEENMPTREIEQFNIPRGNGQKITGSFFREKRITMEGVIDRTENNDLEVFLRSLKKTLSGVNKILDIRKEGGTIFRYIATLQNPENILKRKEHFHIDWTPFDFVFMCKTPFSRDVNFISEAETVSTLSHTLDLENTGGEVSAPVFILIFTATTAITGIKITNNTTGEEIELTANIGSTDVIRFDSEEKEVQINSVIQDYSGIFPALALGVNSFTILLTGTSANYQLTSKFKNNYL